jgi:hypothetical protein
MVRAGHAPDMRGIGLGSQAAEKQRKDQPVFAE